MQPPTDRSTQSRSSRAYPAVRPAESSSDGASSGKLGEWKPEGFEFFSPRAEAQWERQAYRQAINSKDWHLGRPVDPDTQALMDAGLDGPSHTIYQGPDGQHRHFDSRVAEAPEVRTIRMRNFAGKTWAELNASKMPGEDEAVAHHVSKTASYGRKDGLPDTDFLKTRHTEELLPRRNTITDTQAPYVQFADNLSAIPSAPGVEPIPGFSSSPSAAAPKAAPLSSGANAVTPSARQMIETLQVLRPGEKSSNSAVPAETVAKPIDAAVEAFVDPAYRAATQRLLDDDAYADPKALAWQLKAAIDWNIPFAAQNYLSQPGVETGYTLTAGERDAVSQSLRERTLDLLPADRRSEIERVWANDQPLIIKNGPIGLDAVLQALQKSSEVEVFVNGELATSVDRSAAEMRGGEDVELLNEITARKAEAFVRACQEFTDVSHVGGAVDEDGNRRKESYIQNIADRLTTKGSRYMDVTIKLKIDGEPCSFHINTADITSSGMFTAREWQALNDAAAAMRNNGADWGQVAKAWGDRVALGVISKMNAFLALPKPASAHRSKEEMEQTVDDFLRLLSCADIEAACKENAVINRGRGSRTIH